METKKMYEQPQLEVIEFEIECNILTESLDGGSGQAGEGEGDSPLMLDPDLEY
jgi:hypothetical protein